MKFIYYFALSLVCFNISCSDEENVEDIPTKITIHTSSANIEKNQTITFTVIDDLNNNVTNQSTISVNGKEISGNTWTPDSLGSYSFNAYFNYLTSDKLNIEVHEDGLTQFNQRVLIEDYTATWCGYCPSASYAIEQVKAVTDNASVVAIHYNDAMQPSFLEILIRTYEIEFVPTVKLNRNANWTYPQSLYTNQIIDLTNNRSDLGLSIDAELNDNNINLDVAVKFGLYSTAGSKLVVYIIEDGLAYDQSNYTSYYKGVSTIKNFTHNEVLRASLTNALGDAIPDSELTQDNIYTKSFTIAIPENVTHSANMSVVAFVVKPNNQVVNVRTAHFGTPQTFEEL